MEQYLETYANELMIILLTAMVLGTLLVVVPQLLRAHQKTAEIRHAEFLRAMEQGQPAPADDIRSRAAGRTTALVPMVVVCAAATVTCFLVAYKSEYMFAITVTVWAVAGVVSLAAITGGVALMGRLAQLDAGLPDEEGFEEDEGRSDGDDAGPRVYRKAPGPPQ
jgi:hypothetical protein